MTAQLRTLKKTATQLRYYMTDLTFIHTMVLNIHASNYKGQIRSNVAAAVAAYHATPHYLFSIYVKPPKV